MPRKATVITTPQRAGAVCKFDCLFAEAHPLHVICHCYMTPKWAESNPSWNPEELQIGNKVLLHESESIVRSDRANVFWIDRFEKC
jgi:hypothetical protein